MAMAITTLTLGLDLPFWFSYLFPIFAVYFNPKHPPLDSLMASVKSSRSRPHAVTPSKGINKDTGTKLEENLNVFKSDSFDADAYVQSKCLSLNEKVQFYLITSSSSFFLFW